MSEEKQPFPSLSVGSIRSYSEDTERKNRVTYSSHLSISAECKRIKVPGVLAQAVEQIRRSALIGAKQEVATSFVRCRQWLQVLR